MTSYPNSQKGLFDDSGELYGRILEVAMRNNQIRASVGIDSTGTLKDDKDAGGRTRTEKLQGFINKVYNSYRTNSVAIVPKMKKGLNMKNIQINKAFRISLLKN